MSACAYVAFDDLVVCLSDGLRVHIETHQIQGRKEKKLFKVSEQTMILSQGNIIKERDGKGREVPQIIVEYANRRGLTDPVAVAEALGAFIRQKVPRKGADMLCYHVIGFDKAGRVRRFHFNNKNWGQVVEKSIAPGNVGVQAFEAGQQLRHEFIKLHNNIKKDNPHINFNSFPREWLLYNAWWITIRKFEEQGKLFGGETYCETIRPS